MFNKYLILFACLFILTSCFKEDDDDVAKIYANIEGVVNSGNMPVEGAEIHIKNHFDPGGFMDGTALNNGVGISFSVSSPGVYSLDLYRFNAESRIASVFEDTLQVGNHVINIPDSLLTNGIYVYQVTSPFNQASNSNFLINKPDSTLTHTLPYTHTNSLGEFSISAQSLGIDETLNNGPNESFSITDSLQIIVTQNNKIVGRSYLKVAEDVNFVEINIE